MVVGDIFGGGEVGIIHFSYTNSKQICQFQNTVLSHFFWGGGIVGLEAKPPEVPFPISYLCTKILKKTN